jgi:hypothetical protein
MLLKIVCFSIEIMNCPGILEGIAAKFIIGVSIAFNQVYIVEIQTTYKSFNADRPSKT